MTANPIKRSEFLKPLSREHHQGLLLCWKIKYGIKKKIPLSQIKTYVDWFYQNCLEQHFEFEEKYLFSILGLENDLVIQALSHHNMLSQLFKSDRHDLDFFDIIVENLEMHIRFEERVLFDEVQKIATPKQVRLIHDKHLEEIFVDNLTDPFWL